MTSPAWAVLCAALAACAAGALVPAGPRRLPAAGAPAAPVLRRTLRARPRRAALALAAAALAAVALLLGPASGGPPAALLLLTPAAALAWRWRSRVAGRAARVRQGRGEVAAAAHVLSVELRAGRSPPEALAEAATAAAAGRPAAAAAGLGADVAAALLDGARQPGAESLALLGAGWRLTERTGAPLAVVAVRAAEVVRAEEALRRQVAGELASTRSTARLLAVLPLATLGLGSALGGAPWQVLLGTPWGTACGVVGVALAAAGLGWVRRISADAVRSPWVA